MKNIYRQFLTLLIVAFSIFPATTNAQVTNFELQIAKQFAKQWVNSPQEKVYLQTDKPYYTSGENIWFRGYVVNATTHLPKTLSQFLYVELIDKSNTVISRVKIRKDSVGFAGYLKLKPELEAGNYSIRAYTYWMQNASTDFFFNKNITIWNPIDDSATGKIEFGKWINGKIETTVSFNDGSKNPVAGKSLDVSQNWNNPQSIKNSYLTNKEGKINFLLAIDTTNHTTKFIDVTSSTPGLKFKKRLFIPEISTDFDLQFFPESGALLSDTLQVIAFKAVGSDGLSVKVTGKVYSGTNEEIADLITTNKGMGKFSIKMQRGETYYVKVKSNNGIEKRINLPMSQAEGVGLHIVYNRGKIWYEVINKTQKPGSALYLLVHSRGKVYVERQLRILGGQISESILPAGITSFSVIDSVGNTYCERLYFVRDIKSPEIKMESDKAVYGKREAVDLSLNVTSPQGKPCTGNFSISITDNHSIKSDSLNHNILSYLLLSSDIKGYIEDPSGYFTHNLFSDHEKLDLLMLTQAWRRFNTSDVVKGKFTPQTFYVEGGQAITGKVMNVFNKPSTKCGLIMISLYKAKIKLAQTDSLGRYLIDGFEFPDSTTIILKAQKEKSFGKVEIIPDKDVFPASSVFIPYQRPDNSTEVAEYLQQSKEKYYVEGGMRGVNLDAITVKAAKIDKNAHSHYYSGMEDIKYTSDKLDNYPGMKLLDILATMPGIQVDGDNVSIRGEQKSPLFLVDDVLTTSMDEVLYLTRDDIEDILVFKGVNATIFGSKGSSGAIAISLKRGAVQKAEAPVNVSTITPLGFQKPSQFYVPKYKVDSVLKSAQPDLRTTIYWNPKLVTDSNGTVHVKFYTADKSNDYSIVMEGITNNGEICRYTGSLRRKEI